jgi:hypothetical protein
MMERGVPPNIGLICIEVLVHIYECPCATLVMKATQGLAV